ncbi:MAG: hypothetical protein NWF03_05395 [Candidatus Bathyarchaeota archaeon]|nr:hypothetical protein [Candidatus Bathyarchaeota archaeon]
MSKITKFKKTISLLGLPVVMVIWMLGWVLYVKGYNELNEE